MPYGVQMANGFSLALLRFVARGFSKTPQCLLAVCLALLLSQGCSILQISPDIGAPVEAPAKPAPPQPTAKKSPAVPAKLPQTGLASWYGAQHQGKQTASGTIFDQAGLTAAHPSLPFGSKIKVTNLANGKSVEVEITDRGPFAENRIIDLSQAAAKVLDMMDSGTATVRLELPSGQ
jgi:rare lipoprotein A (peptidoglycan hydrolase)